MYALLLAALGALATARITRLIVADRLTLPLRRKVLTRVPEGGSLEYLLSCSWCTSVWVAALVALLVVDLGWLPIVGHADKLALWVLLTLSYSHLTGRWARTEVEA